MSRHRETKAQEKAEPRKKAIQMLRVNLPRCSFNPQDLTAKGSKASLQTKLSGILEASAFAPKPQLTC